MTTLLVCSAEMAARLRWQSPFAPPAQDKDESASSLRAGLPVLSLSIGDSADFLWGSSREEEEAHCICLESGDALVRTGQGGGAG